MKRKQAAVLPIRYGRISGKREDTHTMVFSPSVESLGKAWFVPFQKSVTSYAQFREQVNQLSRAEGIQNENYPNRWSTNWGTVAVKFRPRPSKKLRAFFAQWREEFRPKTNSFINGHMQCDERSPISTSGLLDLNWSIPKGYDYVFATPTVPNDGGYSSPEDIAEAIKNASPDNQNYVRENIRNGIELPVHKRLLELIPEILLSTDD